MDKLINKHFEKFIFDWGHKFYFLVGGYGSSKSYHTALKILLKLLQEKRTALVVRQVFDTLRDSCFSLFCEIIEDLDVFKFCRVSVSPMKIAFKNGSKIIFKGMDKPEKLKSLNNVTVAWVEECSEVSYAGFKELLGRLRHPTHPLHFLLTTNPVDKSNWTYKHFIGEDLELEERLYCEKEICVGNIFYNHSTVDDNFFVKEDYVKQLDELYKYDSDLYRVARQGRFGVSGVLVFPQLEVLPHEKVMAEIGCVSGAVYRVGMDFGFETSYNAVVRMVVDTSEKVLFVYWEYYKNKSTDDVTALELAELKKSGELIRADSAEPKTIVYYQRQGFRMIGAKKFPGSRVQNIKKIKRFSRIVISDSCVNTVSELSGLCYGKDKNGCILPDQFNIDPHTLSAIWYGLDGFELSDVKNSVNYSGKGKRG